MSPDENQGGQPQDDQPVQASTPPATQTSQREAAANLIRGQIDSLYEHPTTEQIGDFDDATNPYNRTHTQTVEPQADQWQQYHTAWQNYYQKYYEGYYAQQLQQSKQPEGYFTAGEPEPIAADEPLSQDEALSDLRHQLLNKVQESAKKVRRSRHFIPITAALFVVLVFLFLQYNSLVTGTVMAYVSPGNVDIQNIVVDPNDTVAVSQDPMLIIPKINVDVPVFYGVGADYNSQMAAMQNGLAQFSIPGASAVPGQVGNVALAGHSSNDLFDKGAYKFIFAQLDKLSNGDMIYADYKGVRYSYVVTSTQVVSPTDVAAVQYSGSKPVMTLITCTPLGTSKNRLLVHAEQVSPDPATAAKTSDTSKGSAATIPGANAPSIFQKLFGAQ